LFAGRFPGNLLPDASLQSPPALLGDLRHQRQFVGEMPIDGAMIHAGISRKLAQAERLGAIRLEPRDRSID
jgi:hypothetical protein